MEVVPDRRELDEIALRGAPAITLHQLPAMGVRGVAGCRMGSRDEKTYSQCHVIFAP